MPHHLVCVEKFTLPYPIAIPIIRPEAELRALGALLSSPRPWVVGVSG